MTIEIEKVPTSGEPELTYEKPHLSKEGSLVELTQGGGDIPLDGLGTDLGGGAS